MVIIISVLTSSTICYFAITFHLQKIEKDYEQRKQKEIEELQSFLKEVQQNTIEIVKNGIKNKLE